MPKALRTPKECRQRIRDTIAMDEDTNGRFERADVTNKTRDAKTPRHQEKPEKEMQVQMMTLVAGAVDVSEVYSPP